MSPVVKVEGFRPTAKMMEFAWAYVALLEKQGTGEIVDTITLAELSQKGMGNDKSLYYKWRKQPNFEKWLNLVSNDFFRGSGLRQVRAANHRRACQNSPQDTKLYYEVNDPEYKPTTSVEHKVSGLRPPDAATEQLAIESSRKRIESITKGEPDE